MVTRNCIIRGALMCVALLTALGCGSRVEFTEKVLDTPHHHVANGYKLLRAEKLEAAHWEFYRAAELDPYYAPAQVGLALLNGYRGDFSTAFETMKRAERRSVGDIERADVYVGYLRLYLLGADRIAEDWLSRAREMFLKATSLVPDDPSAYFFMGLAEKKAYALEQAAEQFARVLELKGEYWSEALAEAQQVGKIRSARPQTEIGRRIALLNEITRAEVAALFIEELQLQKFIRPRGAQKTTAKGRSPGTAGPANGPPRPVVTDIKGHVFERQINLVGAIGIKGLETFQDRSFLPNKMMTRWEYSLIMADILAKITQNDALADRFRGMASPYPDVHSELPYFGAVMLCTTYGILDARVGNGREFDPMGPVSGSEALLAIRAVQSLAEPSLHTPTRSGQ